MNNNSNKNEGFGLIEVIISIAVMSVMLMGIHGIVMLTMKNNKDAQIEQQAAMYGQQIFEDFKSLEVTKTLSGTSLKLSNGLDLTGTGEYKAIKDLGNRYKADITVKANISGIGTALNKEADKHLANGTNRNDFKVALKKEGSKIILKNVDDNKNTTITDSYNTLQPLKLLVYVKKDSKEIIVNDGDDKNLTNKTFPSATDDEKKTPINLIVDLKEYEKESSSTRDTDIVIKVSNEDGKDINIICEDKSENLFVSLEQCGSGIFKFYDEKSSKDLYDITVSITRDGKTIFNGSARENMKVSK